MRFIYLSGSNCLACIQTQALQYHFLVLMFVFFIIIQNDIWYLGSDRVKEGLKRFTYNVVVSWGKGHGNFFSRLPEQLTFAPTPLDSGKNCSSQKHCFGQGVRSWLAPIMQNSITIAATTKDFIIMNNYLSSFQRIFSRRWPWNFLQRLCSQCDVTLNCWFVIRLKNKGVFHKLRGQTCFILWWLLALLGIFDPCLSSFT